MLQYITLNNALEKLVPGDEITFYLPSRETFRGQICFGNIGYYCFLANTSSSKIFKELEIFDANAFVKEIVGYDCNGKWPEVKTLDDFKKVIKALDDECIKKWGALDKNTPQFKVGDKVKILPRDDSAKYLPLYVDSMQKYTGQLATVTIVTSNGCRIDLDNSFWNWPFNALELITSETDETVDPDELKNGDYIKITNSLADKVTYIYIFKNMKDKKICRHVAYHLDSKAISFNPNIGWDFTKTTKINYATEEERKLLNKALLEQGFVWNDLTKQLDFIGLIDLNVQPIDFSTFKNSIQKANDITNLLSCTKEEPQTETELNLFPTKKHYQLNFNY